MRRHEATIASNARCSSFVVATRANSLRFAGEPDAGICAVTHDDGAGTRRRLEPTILTRRQVEAHRAERHRLRFAESRFGGQTMNGSANCSGVVRGPGSPAVRGGIGRTTRSTSVVASEYPRRQTIGGSETTVHPAGAWRPHGAIGPAGGTIRIETRSPMGQSAVI